MCARNLPNNNQNVPKWMHQLPMVGRFAAKALASAKAKSFVSIFNASQFASPKTAIAMEGCLRIDNQNPLGQWATMGESLGATVIDVRDSRGNKENKPFSSLPAERETYLA